MNINEAFAMLEPLLKPEQSMRIGFERWKYASGGHKQEFRVALLPFFGTPCKSFKGPNLSELVSQVVAVLTPPSLSITPNDIESIGA